MSKYHADLLYPSGNGFSDRIIKLILQPEWKNFKFFYRRNGEMSHHDAEISILR